MKQDGQPFSTIEFVNRKMVSGVVRWKWPAEDAGKPRVHFPAWHIGHAAVDYHRALLAPFGLAPELATRYPAAEFATAIQTQPWGEFNPSTQEIADWFWEIDRIGREVIASRDWKTGYPEPLKFFTQTVHTVEDAVYYMIMHNSFHFGRAIAVTGIVA